MQQLADAAFISAPNQSGVASAFGGLATRTPKRGASPTMDCVRQRAATAARRRRFHLCAQPKRCRARLWRSCHRSPKRGAFPTLDCARQIVRYRYLDPDASAEVVAQKLCQDGWKISIRSVYRVFAQFGLQKK